MVNRIIVHLSPEEREALQDLAVHDVRSPADQVRYLVVEEAKRRGMLPIQKNRDAGYDLAATGVSR